MRKVLEALFFIIVMLGVMIGCVLAACAFVIYLFITGFTGSTNEFFNSKPIKYQKRYL